MKANKIIIFGGSFDPIHNGHISAALLALKKLKADKVFFTPSYFKTDNGYVSSNSLHRIKMTKLAIEGYNKFALCKWDIKNKNLYSINLVKYFKNKYPKAQIYLLVGTDQVNNFSNWKEAEKISKLANIIFAQRAGVKLNSQNIKKYKMECIGNTNIAISSSKLRHCSSYKYMNQNVISYINENALYAEQRIKSYLSTKRWQHCLSTARFARSLAKSNKYPNPNEAYVAGLFHDLAKEFSKKDLLKYARKEKIKKYTSIDTLHPIAAYSIMKDEYLFTNKAILQAVYRHTEPVQKNLTLLDKIIYVADKCEPLRKKAAINKLFNVLEVQQLALKDVNQAFELIFKTLKKFYRQQFKHS